MAKEKQAVENEIVLDFFNSAMYELAHNGCKAFKRLRYCSATVYETDNYYILKSYYTFIACIHKSTNICYDALRHEYGYTSTSAQHISKFWHDYCMRGYSDYPVMRYRDI